MLKSLPIIAAIFIITAAFGFRTALRVEPAITIVFYNVENLFDTIDTPDVIDEDFTPTGKLNWNASRYQKKLKDLVKVLSSASGSSYPAAIGLCEIENRAVVEDLMKTAEFNKMNYRVVHEESADDRGIDVAFAYNPKVMSELYHEKMRVRFDFDSKAKTRDILYVKTLAGKDSLHFFVNHWPSRREGQEESEKRRLVPAQMLRAKSDSLRKVNPKAKIIIMGDFNDFDGKVIDANNNIPISQVLDILKGYAGTYANRYELFSVAETIPKNERFSDWWDQNGNCVSTPNEFSTIDHMLVSKALQQGIVNSFFYHGYDEFCETYESDHYPLVIDIII